MSCNPRIGRHSRVCAQGIRSNTGANGIAYLGDEGEHQQRLWLGTRAAAACKAARATALRPRAHLKASERRPDAEVDLFPRLHGLGQALVDDVQVAHWGGNTTMDKEESGTPRRHVVMASSQSSTKTQRTCLVDVLLTSVMMTTDSMRFVFQFTKSSMRTKPWGSTEACRLFTSTVNPPHGTRATHNDTPSPGTARHLC